MGVILFIPVFYIDHIGDGIIPCVSLGLFDRVQLGVQDLTTYLGYGWYITLINAVIGIIISRSAEISDSLEIGKV